MRKLSTNIYWPLATNKSLDPQPRDDAHIIARWQARNELRRAGMRV
jgi:hypothetical protein